MENKGIAIADQCKCKNTKIIQEENFQVEEGMQTWKDRSRFSVTPAYLIFRRGISEHEVLCAPVWRQSCEEVTNHVCCDWRAQQNAVLFGFGKSGARHYGGAAVLPWTGSFPSPGGGSLINNSVVH